MKQILLITLCALTLCACDNSGEGPHTHSPGEPGCRVRRFSSVHVTPFTFHFVGQGSISQGSKCQMKVENVTYIDKYEYNLSDFEEYLTQQIEDHIGREFQPGEGYGYANAKLTNITLYADDVFMGRQAGENIIDLFEVYCDIPLFTFPDGQLIQYMDERSPVTYSYQEFIEKDVYVPHRFVLVVPSENMYKIEKIERSVNFTLTATYYDRRREITDVCICQYDFLFIPW